MNRITQTSSRRTLFTVLALTLTASLLLWQGAALAGTSTGGDTDLGGLGEVVDDVTEEVGDVTEEVVQEINDGTAGNTLPADGDSQESTSGSGASAEGDNLGIDVAGQQVARVGGTQTQSDGDSSSSGATILSLLGHQILGTSSSHEGNGWDSSRFGTLGFTCGLTEGVLCLDLLYAKSWAEGDGSSSSSGSDTDAAYLCLAGDQTNPGETCSGPVALRVLDSHSRSSDDGAAQHSDGGRLCLGNENAGGVCEGVGVTLLHSESSNEGGTEDGSTTLGSLEAQGEEQGSLGDAQTLDLPPDCPEGGSLVCINLNDDNSTDSGDDGREDVDADVAPGANDGGDVVNANAGESDVAEGDGSGGSDDGEVADHPGSGSASATGRVLHIKLLGQEILVFGQSDSSADDDGSSADATVLAVAGHEVIGAHSASENSSGHSETGLLRETCAETQGQACLALLYGQASSEDDADHAHGDSDTAGASACLGASDGTRPAENCDGPVGATVLDSHSESDRDKLNNASDAYESTNGATMCLGGENEDGVCETLGLVVLHSESESHARPGDAEAEGESYVIGIENGGESTHVIEDETSIALPPDCPDGGSIACLLFNEGNTEAIADGITNDETVLDADILPGILEGDDGGEVDEGEAGTEATAVEDAAEEPEPEPSVKPEGPTENPDDDPVVQADAGAVLPFTGIDTSTMLALAMLLLLSGAGVLVLAARRDARRS